MGRTRKTIGQASSDNTETKQTNRQPSGGTGGTGGTGAGTEETGSIGENSQSNLVDKPEAVEIDIPESTEVKPKRKYKKRESKASKPQETKIDATKDISNLIQCLANVASIKFGEHWNISTEESNSIATPLNNILNKFNLVEKVQNVSDGVALVVATTSIILPRVIISQQLNKNKTKEKVQVLKNNGGVKENVEVRNIPTTNIENDRRITTGNISNDGEFIKALCN